MSLIQEIYVKSWASLKRIIEQDFMYDKLRPFWVFRGQANHRWSLTTSIERLELIVEESKIIQEFQRNAHLYADTKKIDNTLEWLSLMQHYGAPTRLLDWTFSPYVALFFAMNEAKIDIYHSGRRYAALYALNYSPINVKMRERYKNHKTYSFLSEDNFLFKNKISDTQFEDVFFSIGSEDALPPTVLPLIPFNSHIRLNTQQGIFLCPTNGILPFEENLKTTFEDIPDYERWIRKYLIPVELKPEIIIELNHMNINDATLFPGIEGYSRFLKKKYSLGNEEDKAYVLKQKQQ